MKSHRVLIGSKSGACSSGNRCLSSTIPEDVCKNGQMASSYANIQIKYYNVQVDGRVCADGTFYFVIGHNGVFSKIIISECDLGRSRSLTSRGVGELCGLSRHELYCAEPNDDLNKANLFGMLI